MFTASYQVNDSSIFDYIEIPQQCDSVVQTSDQQVWIFIPINIQTSSQRVPESPEPRRDAASPDHLQRDEGGRLQVVNTLPVIILRCVYSETWLGSVETPSLLPVQIITLPVSWKGAPTAKSERQKFRFYRVGFFTTESVNIKTNS